MPEEWIPSARLQDLSQDQRARWRRGERPRVETYLERYPELEKDEALLLDLICAEFSVRTEHGESPTLQEYVERFPKLAPQLEMLFEVLQALDHEFSPAAEQETTTDLRADGLSDSGSQDTVNGSNPSPASNKNRGGIPADFGPYEVIEEIARGGMGVVYKARQRNLDRIVALKMILPRQFQSESALRRFQIEAEAAAKLDHPGIVPIFDIGEHEGQQYICMAFVDGESLAARVSRGRLIPNEAALLVRKVAQAVQHAHERGIIHRDLKPANILVDGSGRPRVTDFGLARRCDAAGGLTMDGSILGTPSYMSPEQAAGETDRLGPASDIYSLGAVLFHLLTGQPPITGPNVLEILRKVCEESPKSVREIDASIPEALDAICRKCLAKNPADRYATGESLADDLNRFLEGDQIAPSPLRPVEKSSRSRLRASALGSFGVLLLILSAAFFWQKPAARQPNDPADLENNATMLSNVTARKPTAGPATSPLSGDLTIRIWDPDKKSRRHGLTFDSRGALPLHYGDAIRIEAKTNRPAYLYLVWITPDGEAIPVYPWKPASPWKSEYWKLRPKFEKPLMSLSLPEEADTGWPIDKDFGLETIVLLARDEPLPTEAPLSELLSGLPPQRLRQPPLFVWLERGQPNAIASRSPNFSRPRKIDDSTLKMKRMLGERLQGYFPVMRAVCLANRGS